MDVSVGNALRQSFQDSVQDMLAAERNLLTSLVRMSRGLRSPEISATFKRCRGETQVQIERLHRILNELDPERTVRPRHESEEERLAPSNGSTVLDAVLASAIQAVHRYSATRYAALKDWADHLGLPGPTDLLSQTMEEKAAAVERLEPLTELRPSDFSRAEAIRGSTNSARTVVISNDNKPADGRRVMDSAAKDSGGIRG